MMILKVKILKSYQCFPTYTVLNYNNSFRCESFSESINLKKSVSIISRDFPCMKGNAFIIISLKPLCVHQVKRYVCVTPLTLYLAADSVTCVQSELYALPTRIYSLKQEGFDKFTHKYSYIQQTYKRCKGHCCKLGIALFA